MNRRTPACTEALSRVRLRAGRELAVVAGPGNRLVSATHLPAAGLVVLLWANDDRETGSTEWSIAVVPAPPEQGAP